MKNNFATQFTPRQRVHEVLGSREKQLYAPIYDDRGVLYLKETGKHDLYAEIQSHRDSVDIHVLLARYRNGDAEALQRVQGVYGDFTQMPTTFAEALNTLIAAEQCFQSLPVEVRSRFGHDLNRFIASMDSPTWATDVGIDLPDPPSSAAPGGASQESNIAPIVPPASGTPVVAPSPGSIDTISS